MKNTFPGYRQCRTTGHEIRFMSVGIKALSTSCPVKHYCRFHGSSRSRLPHFTLWIAWKNPVLTCTVTPCLCWEYFFPRPVQRAHLKLLRFKILSLVGGGKSQEKRFIFRTIANISFARSANDMNISWHNSYNEHSQQISSRSMTGVAHETEETQCVTHVRHDFPNKRAPISHETGLRGLEQLKHSAVKGFPLGYLSATPAAKGLLIWMSLIIWQSLRKWSNYQ